MSVDHRPLPGTVDDPLYPHEDGKLLGESDYHMDALIWLREALQDYFARRNNVYVASDMFWYWEQGNPSANKAPDVMVVKGVGKHQRYSFRSWEENARPCVVFEIASSGSWQDDIGAKRILYAQLGVPEYFVFDPEGVYLDPTLQGFRSVNGKAVPLTAAADGSLTSGELGLRLTVETHLLRLRHARSGRRILTGAERAQRAERKARQAEERARAADQRAQEERQRAERKTRQAEERTRAADQRAQEERQRAERLEAELARLRASLPPGTGAAEEK
jgi:Uma2 family endonuclease